MKLTAYLADRLFSLISLTVAGLLTAGLLWLIEVPVFWIRREKLWLFFWTQSPWLGVMIKSPAGSPENMISLILVACVEDTTYNVY